jgi:hypothetical protein
MNDFEVKLDLNPNVSLAERLISTITYKGYVKSSFNLPSLDELLDWRIRLSYIKIQMDYPQNWLDREIEATDFLLSLHRK